ncbi:hypothetical protein C9F11_46285 (plasmid) [Streptomyces sp. YIM 121038]|uniref:recombinase family protein n=1 Tax=Streptomyces sp. YIM 121038 TaxID=2136401 RepID=UPI001163E004|nr:recombinase family protein [Streptomyces sp. YIM 121038]QCX82807.1 hypothetical protein C9F11_46285 [Streptomyces sp. YIM 121038]
MIDTDQGQSGASAADREGFQRLVTEVGMGHAGIVLGLEVSRLARNNTDWHRLLELCAMAGTLILDEDGLYDPCDFNDRLLLGLKGTMSEAELHLLKGRLRGGQLSKARRGELISPLPIGLVYDLSNKVVLDPDAAIVKAITLVFERFDTTGSATGVVKSFNHDGLKLPRRLASGPNKGTVVWAPIAHSRVLQILHNPRYAGAFVYGRHGHRLGASGKMGSQLLPRDEWFALFPDAHVGYISFEKYGANQAKLTANCTAHGQEREAGPPREGPALLQGAVVCGICGNRMTVRYHQRKHGLEPEYNCQAQGIEYGGSICQRIPGAGVDAAVGRLLVEALTPLAIEAALAVAEELTIRAAEADRLRQAGVDRARYQADLARRRYLAVDPDNRLVAQSLEADWNTALRELNDATDAYEQAKATGGSPLDDTLVRDDEQITAHVRLRGGQAHTLTMPAPLTSWQIRQTPPGVVAAVDQLLDEHTDGQIAAILTAKGHVSGTGQPLQPRMVQNIRRAYGLRSHPQRLADQGMASLREIARRLGVCLSTVQNWRNRGLLTGRVANDKGEYFYYLPRPASSDLASADHRRPQHPSNQPEETQYEARGLSFGFAARAGSTRAP